MEEKKLKEIEAKLHQLLLQLDKSKNEGSPSPSTQNYRGTVVIRRRKGQKDLHIN